MHAQIVLRKIPAAAAYFVDLRMLMLIFGRMRHALDARPNAAAVRFCPDGLDLDPIATCRGITAQKLGKIVHRIYDHVEVAVIVKVSESTAARCDERRYARPGIVGNVIETAVASILVEQLALRVFRLGLQR